MNHTISFFTGENLTIISPVVNEIKFKSFVKNVLLNAKLSFVIFVLLITLFSLLIFVNYS